MYALTLYHHDIGGPLARIYAATYHDFARMLETMMLVVEEHTGGLADDIIAAGENLDAAGNGDPVRICVTSLVILLLEAVPDTRELRAAYVEAPQDATPEQMDLVRSAAEQWAIGNHAEARTIAAAGGGAVVTAVDYHDPITADLRVTVGEMTDAERELHRHTATVIAHALRAHPDDERDETPE